MATTASSAGERSYGIIPLRMLPASTGHPTPGNTHVLLIHQKTIVPSRPYFWTFPKGHAEDGDESVKHTAVRELFEETGLWLGVEDLLVLKDEEGQEIEFKEVYTNPVRRIGKEVRYWVGFVQGGQEVKVQAAEVNDARWLSWDEAEKTITFDEGRAMLRRLKACLQKGETASSVL